MFTKGGSGVEQGVLPSDWSTPRSRASCSSVIGMKDPAPVVSGEMSDA